MNAMQAHGTLLLEVIDYTSGRAWSVPRNRCLCGLQQDLDKAKMPLTKLIVLSLVSCSLPACQSSRKEKG